MNILKNILMFIATAIVFVIMVIAALYLTEYTLRKSEEDRPPHTPYYKADMVTYYGKYDYYNKLAKEKELNMGSYLFI